MPPWERDRNSMDSLLLDCHVLCDLFFGSQISVVEDPLFNFPETLIFTMAAGDPFNVTELTQEAVL